MNEIKESNAIDKQKEWESDIGDWIWPFLIFSFCFGGWENFENAKISELEKEVKKFEKQLSMIGGNKNE